MSKTNSRGRVLTMTAVAVAAYMATDPAYTRDVAIAYRMDAGFPGDVNRTHPCSIEPCKINTTTPPTAYGHAVLVDTATNSVREVAAGDTGVTKLYGLAVRPYPEQQRSGGMTATIGAATPPTSGVLDVCRSGYIMTKIPAGQAVTKGGAVYLWVAADSGSHKQGFFENAASAGNTAAIANAYFNGPADASGNVEIFVFPA